MRDAQAYRTSKGLAPGLVRLGEAGERSLVFANGPAMLELEPRGRRARVERAIPPAASREA